MQKDMSYEDRIALTRAIMSILDEWGLQGADQVTVLDLPQGTPLRSLRKYRDNTPFPDHPATLERIEHIIGIADALRTSYPHNPPMGALWLRQVNRRFQDRSPLAIIVDDGLDGLVHVRSHLDCSYDWHVDKDNNL